jgi:hypothetical protein
VWSAGGAGEPALAAVATRLAALLGLERAGGPGIVAGVIGTEVKVGWPALADSTTFAEALADLADGGATGAYLDLELLLEWLVARARSAAGSGVADLVAQRVAASVRRLGLRYVAVRFDGASGTGQGVIAHRPNRFALHNTLHRERPLTALPEVDPQSRLQLEVSFEPDALQRLARDLTRLEDGQGDWLGGLAGQMGGMVRLQLLDLLGLLAGRLSVHVDPLGALAEATLQDPAQARRWLERRQGSGVGPRGWRMGPATVQLDGSIARLSIGAARAELPPRPVTPPASTLLWCAFALPAGAGADGMTLALEGGSDTRTPVRLQTW